MDDGAMTGGSFRTTLKALVFVFFTDLELTREEDIGGDNDFFFEESKEIFAFCVLTMVKCLSFFEKP